MKKFLLTVIIAMAALTCVAGTNNSKQPTSQVNTERVEQQNQDPVVGTYKGHQVRQGKRGGLYWTYIAKSGKHAGEQARHYLSKAEKEEFNQAKGK